MMLQSQWLVKSCVHLAHFRLCGVYTRQCLTWLWVPLLLLLLLLLSVLRVGCASIVLVTEEVGNFE
jgi:hypothetical protein